MSKVNVFVGHLPSNKPGEFKVILKSGEHRKEYNVEEPMDSAIRFALNKIKVKASITLYTQAPLPKPFAANLSKTAKAKGLTLAFSVHK